MTEQTGLLALAKLIAPTDEELNAREHEHGADSRLVQQHERIIAEADRVVAVALTDILGDSAAQAVIDRHDADRLCERLEKLVARRRELVSAANKAWGRFSLWPPGAQGAHRDGDVVRELAAFDSALLKKIEASKVDDLMTSYSEVDVATWTANGDPLNVRERAHRYVRSAVSALTSRISEVRNHKTKLDPAQFFGTMYLVGSAMHAYKAHANQTRGVPLAPDLSEGELFKRIFIDAMGSKAAIDKLDAQACKDGLGQGPKGMAIALLAGLCDCDVDTIRRVVDPGRAKARADNLKEKRSKARKPQLTPDEEAEVAAAAKLQQEREQAAARQRRRRQLIKTGPNLKTRTKRRGKSHAAKQKHGKASRPRA